jgi:hypothetical protein
MAKKQDDKKPIARSVKVTNTEWEEWKAFVAARPDLSLSSVIRRGVRREIRWIKRQELRDQQ